MKKIDLVMSFIIGCIATAFALSLILGDLPNHKQTEIESHQEYLNENPRCGFLYTEDGKTEKVMCADADGILHEPEYYVYN